MKKSKFLAVLFDADGVTITPKAPFSVQYAAIHGFDAKKLGSFFNEKFSEALIGKRDLKQLLEEGRELWHWEGSVEGLLEEWFETENHVNTDLIALIQQLRAKGIKCYLAMNQEKYRTKYIKEKMFPTEFDKIFSSAEIGFKKPDTRYYEYIINELRNDHLISGPNDLAYLDDSVSNVESAKSLGIASFLYTNVSLVKQLFIV